MSRDLFAREVWLPSSSSQRVGRGVRLTTSPVLVAWEQLGAGPKKVVVRRPDEPAFEVGHQVCSEVGPCVDLGSLACDGVRVHRVDPRRSRHVGHAVVERRGVSLRGIGGSLPALPEAAREQGARPWPVRPGWAWAWGDTLYRRAPDGRVSVAARVPGSIRAWDVGPDGAAWCVGAGCLWWAPPRRFACRVSDEDAESAGVDVDAVESGELLFSDDGMQVIAARRPGARSIRRAGLGVSTAVGAVGWMPDHSLVQSRTMVAARVACVGRWVWRVTQNAMLGWHEDGQVCGREICLPSPPLDARAHAADAITVLTAKGTLGLTLAGSGCAPDLSVLLGDHPSVGLCRHGAQTLWWSEDGGVVTGISQG